MENKQVKMVGGVNRSTQIDLQSIERDVASLAGRAATTPISMKVLYDEVQNLKATNLKVKEINSSTTGTSGSEQAIATLITSQAKIYAHLSVTFTGTNGVTKEINIYGNTGNFSQKVEANGNWSSGYRPYAILTRSGNSVMLKSFLTINPGGGHGVKIRGFIIY